MQKELLVSVIIPNYNHAAYLEERIQSVLNQTYQNFEIIILDDKSTDNSLEIINRYKDHPKISHVIVNKENSGSPFSQWNKGFELAKGDLIWIAESDDVADRSFLSNTVPSFDDDYLVMAFTRSFCIDENGNDLGVFYTQRSYDKNILFDKGEFIQRILKKHNFVVNASSAVFRKSNLSNIPIDYQMYRGCGDWLLWIYMAEMGKVAFLSNPLNKFRQHGINTTKKQDRNGENEKEIHKIFNYLDSKNYYSYWERKKFVVSRMGFHDMMCPFDSSELYNQFEQLWNISIIHKLMYNKQKMKWKTHIFIYNLIHGFRGNK